MSELIVFQVIVLVVSIVLHEVSHGYAANSLGDPTARLAGRLTLNPIRHIDPLGSLLIPGLLLFSGSPILFGYAKPVPYNPYNLRGRFGEAMVAAAGPGVNLLLALLFGILIRFAVPLGLPETFVALSAFIVYINILLALFNLIPVPPLDGSKVIEALLPGTMALRWRAMRENLERFGLLFTFGFLFLFISVFWSYFAALVRAVFTLITGFAP